MNNADMPAMPSGVQLDNKDPQSMYHPNGVMQCHGLTKREMMAMHIMASIATTVGYQNYGQMAQDATAATDALLAELDRTSK